MDNTTVSTASGNYPDNPVNCIEVDDSGNIYIGGAFSSVSGTSARLVAKWNGSSWTALGSGLTWSMQSSVDAMAWVNGNLYVAGNFTVAGTNITNFAYWNGSSWNGMGSQVSLASNVFTKQDKYLYTYVNNPALNPTGPCFATWNGSVWSRLGISGISGSGTLGISSLHLVNQSLYAGGVFDSIDGVSANNIAMYQNEQWTAMGTGTGTGDDMPNVMSMTNVGLLLYVGGLFWTAGGIANSNPPPEYVGGTRSKAIASWNGSAWSAINGGMESSDDYPSVNALAEKDGVVFAGGMFSTAGGNSANHIAQWNSGTWTAMGQGLDSTVSALKVINGILYAGGYFSRSGGSQINYFGYWDADNTTWKDIGT